MIRSSLESKLYILQSALVIYHQAGVALNRAKRTQTSGELPSLDFGRSSLRADPNHLSLQDQGCQLPLGFVLEHGRPSRLEVVGRLYLLDSAQ
jgi:hypothetical protein